VPNLDVLIHGGGVAGLWTLDRLRRDGWKAALVETTALGTGQTIASQGIIHGGGKYALRGVKDFEAVKVIRDMPDRWRRSLRDEERPHLSKARLLSDRCLLWLTKGAGLLQKGMMAVVEKAGLLNTKPELLDECDWPEALRGSASAVWTMAEPVFETGPLLAALAAPHRDVLYRAADGLSPRVTVLAAGEGNASLLKDRAELMQRRPLQMVVLKGPLPPLYGHCVIGGKTGLTITSVGNVWQIGGEIAEQCAEERETAKVCGRALDELRKYLPRLNLDGCSMSSYRAVRAEASTSGGRRPSGTNLARLGPGLLVAWPTKLALAPVLADEIAAEVSLELKSPGRYDPLPPAHDVPVARYPWENAEWNPVR
jgi:glycine/D-amino acid oxidase-like deaminating enzyme